MNTDLIFTLRPVGLSDLFGELIVTLQDGFTQVVYRGPADVLVDIVRLWQSLVSSQMDAVHTEVTLLGNFRLRISDLLVNGANDPEGQLLEMEKSKLYVIAKEYSGIPNSSLIHSVTIPFHPHHSEDENLF